MNSHIVTFGVYLFLIYSFKQNLQLENKRDYEKVCEKCKNMSEKEKEGEELY